MTTTSTAKKPGGARVHVQRFGTFLSGMVMPTSQHSSHGGLITAFFIATGWLPSGILGGFGDAGQIGWHGAATMLAQDADGKSFQQYVGLVTPMITYLLPLLIANTGGRMIYGVRGGVVGTIATMGVIVGSDIPMFIGAMIMGPLSAWLMKKVDSLWEDKIKAGFEMLVNNFSAGILGALLSIGAFFGIAPVVEWLSSLLGGAVNWLVSVHLLPLASILIEPGKFCFSTTPSTTGCSLHWGSSRRSRPANRFCSCLKRNPGPGLGILLAFLAVRSGHGQGQRTRCDHHRVLRRHPRDLLPVRADEAAHGARRDRRRHDRELRSMRHSRPGCVRPLRRAASSPS